MYGLPDTPSRRHYYLVNFSLEVLNGCISFTKLENVANFNVLFLTIRVSRCSSLNNRSPTQPFSL